VLCTGGGIGDVLLATPVMRALHARYGRVVALTTPAHRAVLANAPFLAEVWTDELGFAQLAARIARERFEASVTTWATLRSAALPYVARIPQRVGQARRLYSPLFNKRVIVRSELGDRTTHWTQILLDFARALECDVDDATPTFTIGPADEAEYVDALIERSARAPYVVLHPTRGISAARERWPIARFVELGRALAQQLNAQLVVTGGAEDASIAQAIADSAGGISFGGSLSLGAYAALARGARAVVAMDSGPMHVAAAVGAPTVGIFALQSDEPDRWAPLGARVAVVRATYPCPPGHRKETCPDFACVAALDIETIVGTVELVRRRVTVGAQASDVMPASNAALADDSQSASSQT
jgi:heptosyltransferase-2